MVTESIDQPVVEIGEHTWRLQSALGERYLYQYLLASSDGGEALLVDTGTMWTPREVVIPALRYLGLPEDAVQLIVVTHPDVDHQGGLAAMKERIPDAMAGCGFADRPMVEDPETLLRDRYEPYLREHGLGCTPEEKRWIRANYGAHTPVDLTFSGGESVRLGDREIDVLHAPGHSAGHLVVFDRRSQALFSSDAVHWRGCPRIQGGMALCPTYEDVDAYLESIDLVESLAPAELHSAHWPMRSGAGVFAFTRDSRAFVEAVDQALLERLEEPASLGELCERVQQRMGPWNSEPAMLRYALFGHVRRLVGNGAAEIVDPTATPRCYRLRQAPDETPDVRARETLGAVVDRSTY